MPRQPRQKSFTNVYHIMMRGNEKKNIFIDNEDRYKYLDILSNKKQLSGYDIYAYCLMSNHIHLLMKENDESIALCLKRINVSYAYYFNKKYNRVGHLFQDRFKSECIITEQHLLSALRYIHNNPVKAGIVTSPREYVWSSYNSYILNSIHDFVDKYEMLSLFSNNMRNAIVLFQRFSEKKSEDCFIDCEEDEKDDCFYIKGIAEARSYIKTYLSNKKIDCEGLKDRQNTAERDELIYYIKTHSNLSIREISEALGLNRGVVQRAKPKVCRRTVP